MNVLEICRWQTGSDAETMENAYMMKLKQYMKKDDADKETLCNRYTHVARLLGQVSTSMIVHSKSLLFSNFDAIYMYISLNLGEGDVS